MAVAEVRAAWQRTANHCFVQVDAKGAPKLACCQSSSLSKQIDGGRLNAADMPDNPAVDPLPLHRNISYSNLPPDTRWWLQLQPSYGYQKGLAYEQLNALEAEMESLRAEIVNSPSKIDEVPPHDDRHSRDFDCNTSTESSFDAHCRISADRMSKDPEVNNQEVNVLYDKNAQEFTALKDTSDNSKWIGIDPVECVQPQKSNDYCFDPETFWIRGEKNVPWWRTTDKDDLASLLTQKSIDYFGNCDLPPPQMLHFRRSPCGCPGSSDHHDAIPSSLDWEAQSERQRASTGGHLQSGSEKPFRYLFKLYLLVIFVFDYFIRMSHLIDACVCQNTLML